jgi:hypothetical protein
LREDRDKEFEEVPEEVEGEEDAERRGIPGDLIWVQDQVSATEVRKRMSGEADCRY